MAGLSTEAPALFKGRGFDATVIVLCIRWYLTHEPSSRDLQEMMAERGVQLAHTTIVRWVQRYMPEFEKRWRPSARPVGGSWRVDETYSKVKGRWTHLYRAVDKQGRTVDILLSEHRDNAAATRVLLRAVGHGRAREDHIRRLRGLTPSRDCPAGGRDPPSAAHGEDESVSEQSRSFLIRFFPPRRTSGPAP